MENKRYPDVVGVGGTDFPGERACQIPYGALVPVKVDNLLAAGRCIAADNLMLNYMRLIGPCLVSGPGRRGCRSDGLRAGAVRADVDVAKFQALLKKQGAYLGIGRWCCRPSVPRLATGLLLGYVACFLPAAWRFAAPALSPFLAVCAALTVRSLLAGFGLRAAYARVGDDPPPVLVPPAVPRRPHFGVVRQDARRPHCGQSRAFAMLLARGQDAGAGDIRAERWRAIRCFSGWIRWRSTAASSASDESRSRGHALRRGRTSARDADQLSVSGRVVLPHLPVGRNAGFRWHWPGSSGAAGTFARGRRAFLTLGAGMLCGVFLPRSLGRPGHPPLRPPGAVGETAFQGGCIRCGSCSRACPAGIIELAIERHDIAGFLAPQLAFTARNTAGRTATCAAVFVPQHGVMQDLALSDKNRSVIGIAAIEKDGLLSRPGKGVRRLRPAMSPGRAGGYLGAGDLPVGDPGGAGALQRLWSLCRYLPAAGDPGGAGGDGVTWRRVLWPRPGPAYSIRIVQAGAGSWVAPGHPAG